MKLKEAYKLIKSAERYEKQKDKSKLFIHSIINSRSHQGRTLNPYWHNWDLVKILKDHKKTLFLRAFFCDRLEVLHNKEKPRLFTAEYGYKTINKDGVYISQMETEAIPF